MASANPFDLLNDDAQDQEIHIPVVKKAAKPSAPKPAAASAPKSSTTSTTTDNKGPRKATARPSQPKDNDIPRGPRYDRAPREGEATPRAPGGSRVPRGGRGGIRGGRHGGYDRHSGTGKVESENKENNRLGDPTAAPLEGEKDAAMAVESGAATPELVEPEAVVKTLDDYLQERAAKALKIALPEARAANSGADNAQWKDAKVLEVEETGDFIKMGKESVAKSRKGKKGSKVLITDIDVRYAEPAREQSAPRSAFRGGGGGGRGSDRPRGSRGGGGGVGARGGNHAGSGPRRNAPGGSNVNVNDTELFPSLGSQ
ncbi:hypothetical protein BGZ70_002035 [Mortierella alpina]|uniref:Hyaluronan/mRNA-binding protein domain-containing protein n=1 Tax=Mortierella alpina TaxID=64518 RepID=A0A9P6JB93_MORAP|nr:hypothetical protein BGZ70_002035 [Mortierella alpina]